MSLFVPDSLPARPAVLVAVHYCTGTAQAMYNGSQFDELATRYGYIVIYPQANRSGSCFDVELVGGADARRRAATRPASCRWSGTCSSGTRPTPAGCSSPACRRAR